VSIFFRIFYPCHFGLFVTPNMKDKGVVRSSVVVSRSLPDIPADLLLELLSFLSPTHLLANVACVCRSWQKLIQTSRLWKPSFFVLHSRLVPSERTCHTAVVHKNKMFVLGGMDKSNTIHGIKKELAILNFDSMTWSIIAKDIPGLTEHSCIVWRQSLLTFGGYNEDNSACCNRIYEGIGLDSLKPTFRSVTTTGDEPSGRSAHVALLHEDVMYISGGWNCRFTVTFDDLFALDLRTHVWEQLPSSPHAARAHCGFVYDNSIFLFGGCNNENQSLSDLQRYDIGTREWRIQPVRGDVPLGRSRCRGVLYHKHFILIGGWNRQVYYDELYVLSVETMTWMKVGTHSMPAVVQHSVALNGDRLYCFAGFVRRNQSQLGGGKDRDPRSSDGDHSSDDGSGKKHANKKKKLDFASLHTQTNGFGPPSPNPWNGDTTAVATSSTLATSGSTSSSAFANGHHPHGSLAPPSHSQPSLASDAESTVSAAEFSDLSSDVFATPDAPAATAVPPLPYPSSDDDDTDGETSTIDGEAGPLPANPTLEQQTREDGMGQLCNTLYCYLCFHAVGS